jgi:hypothetical protein
MGSFAVATAFPRRPMSFPTAPSSLHTAPAAAPSGGACPALPA